MSPATTPPTAAPSGRQRTGWNDAGKLLLEGGRNDTFVMGQGLNLAAPNPFVSVFDGSGETPVRDAPRFADGAGSGALNLKDVAVSPDGAKVALADARAGTRLLNNSDLSDAATGYQALPSGATAGSVAFSGDGKYIARGASATGATPDLLVRPATRPTPAPRWSSSSRAARTATGSRRAAWSGRRTAPGCSPSPPTPPATGSDCTSSSPRPSSTTSASPAPSPTTPPRRSRASRSPCAASWSGTARRPAPR